MEKVSLVLEGGGMRGVYTAGVLDLFLNKNLDIGYCIGVSAGACHGVSYISKQYKRNYNVNIKYIKDKRYLSFRNLIKTGSLFGMDMLFDIIPNQLEPIDYNAFKESKTIFKVGVTNCNTGLPEYYEVTDLNDGYDPIKASISLPLISPVVKLGEKEFLDGGIADPIPIKKAIEDGNEKHIVILTQHKGYIKERTKGVPIIKRKYRKYPKLVESMSNRHETYNNTLGFLDELEKMGKCFVIRPSKPLNVSRFEKNPENLKNIYKQGYDDAKRAYKDLVEFLNI